MKLQTSTIVMALVTCVPFGLAIRDTVNGKDRVADEDEDEDEDEYGDSTAELEEYGREQERIAREDEEREAREKATRAEMRKELFSDQPAALGGRLASLRLGAPISSISERTQDSFERLGEQTGTQIGLDGDITLDAIVISDSYVEDDLCGWLDRELRARWGAPVDRVWWNEANRVRARLEDESGCVLTIERAVRPADWYGQTPTAVIPTWAIGKAPAKLLETLPEAPLDVEGMTELSWTAAGLGRGEGTTSLEAGIDNGKIVSIHASTRVTPEDGEALVAHLTGIHGEPTTDDTGFVWKKAKPAVKLELDSGYAYLTVGKLND